MNHKKRIELRKKVKRIYKSEQTKNDIKKKQEERDEPMKRHECKYSGYVVGKVESKSTNIYQNEAMKAGILCPAPASYMCIGTSGSGKTNTMIWCLLNESMLGNYFERIYLIGHTVKSDHMYSNLDIPEKNIIDKNLVEETGKLINKLEKESNEKGAHNMLRTLIIFEDCTTNKALLRSPEFAKCYVQGRHFGCSVWANGHKYLNVLPPLIRNNTNGLLFFPAPNREVSQVMEDYIPNGVSKKDFSKLIEEAHTKGDGLVKPFLFIQKKADPEIRFRKGFHKILSLPKYKNDRTTERE
jgi:hypothetical protein